MLQVPRHSNPVAELMSEVLRVAGPLMNIFARVHAAGGLSPIEATILAAVVESSVAPTVPQIGRSLGHNRQVVQRAANALMAAGLIEKAPNPHHKLAPLLLPTRQGKKLKQKVDERAIEVAGVLLKHISGRKCRLVAGQVRDLRHEIEAHLHEVGAG